jgi:hypothetical protein
MVHAKDKEIPRTASIPIDPQGPFAAVDVAGGAREETRNGEAAMIYRKMHARRGLRMAVVTTALTVALDIPKAGGQGMSAGPVICETTSIQERFAHCALWIDKADGVRRGDSGILIGRSTFFRSLSLEALVTGDSARWYARRYQSSVRSARWFQLIGATLSVGAFAYAQSKRIELIQLPMVSGNRGRTSPGVTAAFLAGLVISTGFHYPGVARASKIKAIWWHNRELLR